MKKAIASMVAVMATAAAFAAANDMLITFSTKGDDTYADGSYVLDGERYALCWSTDFSKFSIGADGVATGGKIVVAPPVAKNRRCPTVVFEIDAAKAATEYSGGSFAIYLLDTRRYADGKVVGLAGGATSINAAGAAGGTVSVSTGAAPTSIDTSSAVAASAETALPSGVPQPTVTKIDVEGGFVYVKVKGTVPYLAYSLKESSTPGGEMAGTDSAQSGAALQDEEITLITPAKNGGAFLRVGRK